MQFWGIENMQGEEGEILDCFTFDLEKPKFLVAYFVIC